MVMNWMVLWAETLLRFLACIDPDIVWDLTAPVDIDNVKIHRLHNTQCKCKFQ